EIAEIGHVLRQWDGIHRTVRKRDRRAETSLRGLREREPVESTRVAAERNERLAILTRCGADVPARPVELAELHVRPGGRFRLADRSAQRELHHRDGTRVVTPELTRIRDACI